ncbi:PH domain-containing protein [Methanohalophilus mahii]|uniref:Membrane-flanked domain protein n=1 Tax=Methanohalophilus mahii (strain ATCC 35705 / DSM 5219 / SLP) TaxID=547558 RepID=D5E8Z1_METMS|nr:PH domain-containing protein [Methanohalophilus mahii]ADE37522.1 membrane-flanked domain protein [Methanohalophilus mahii DSM 5219]
MKMSEYKRQHPFMIILETVKSIIYAIPPVFFFALSTRNELSSVDIPFLAAIALIATLTYSTAKWYLFTYQYENGYLHIRKGLLFKKERSIKRERVQTVNVITNFIQKLLGITSLHVKTAGSTEAELSLTAITLQESQNIKTYLENHATDRSSKNHTEESETRNANVNTYNVPLWNLLLAGATSGRFMLLFSLIAAALSQLYPYIPERYLGLVLEQVISQNNVNISLLLILIFGLLLLSWIISTLVFAIQYANFTLQRQEDDIRISYGLIEQKEYNLNMKRIQALSVKKSLLRQPFSLCSIYAEVAGGSSEKQDYVTTLYPLLHARQLSKFMDNMFPEYSIPEDMHPLPLRSRKRYIIRLVVPVLVIVLLLQLVPYGWVSLLVLPPAFLLGLSRYNTGGTAILEEQLTLRFRNIHRYQVFVLRDHIQTMQISSNPFQRMSDLDTIRISVLSSRGGNRFTIADVDREESGKIWNWFSRN